MNGGIAALSHEQILALYHEREIAMAQMLAEKDQRIAEIGQHLAEKDQRIAEIGQHLAEKDQRIARLTEDVAEKADLIARLQRMLFGSKRERFVNDNQILLPFLVDPAIVKKVVAEAVEDECQKITYERRTPKKHPGRMPLPEHLPVVEVVHEPLEDVSGMRRIGEEVTDQLGYKPAEFFILRIIRPKYVAPEDEQLRQQVIVAAMPSRPLDKSIAGAELLAQIIIDKYLYHLPIYRQTKRFAADGVTIAVSTVDSWLSGVARLLHPLYAGLGAIMPHVGYLQVDESTIPVQDRATKGRTHRGYMWVYHAVSEKVVFFDYRRGRGAGHCKAMLEDFAGYLQTDAYAAYELHRARADVVPLSCWAHVRRKFFEAKTNDPERAHAVLRLIGMLYAVERDARERSLTPEQRKELRLERSLPLINEIGAFLANEHPRTTPRSPIGKAIGYAVSLWDELQTYLLDGSLEIDNNLIESSIRPLALGRKNYLFAGSHDGAVNLAMYLSFFATCLRHEIDPRRWLTYVLRHIRDTSPKDYHTLLPQSIDRTLLS